MLAPVRGLDRGQYTRETVSGEPAICCPACGEIFDLEKPYRVLPHSGGMVSPIWQCPSESCGFRDFLVLESYDESVVPA